MAENITATPEVAENAARQSDARLMQTAPPEVSADAVAETVAEGASSAPGKTDRSALIEPGGESPAPTKIISGIFGTERASAVKPDKTADVDDASHTVPAAAAPAPEKKDADKKRGGRPPKADKPGKTPEQEKTKRTPRLPTGINENSSADTPPPAPEPPKKPIDVSKGVKKETVVYLNFSELHPFKNHPFGVRDDAEMRSLVDSVKNIGVSQPAIVRPREDGGYEIIAGHRRQKASELAGYANMPCIVRNLSDDDAILAMTDDNLRQRAEILPSEKAQSLKMQMEAIKHQGARGELGNIAAGDIGKRSTEIVGQRNGMNGKQVQRYIRLTALVPELRELADTKKLGFTPAVEISYIKATNQQYIAVSMDGQQSAPSLAQAQRMRDLDQKGQLNGDVIDGIMCEEKKEVDKVIISGEELNKYFGRDKTPQEMKNQIIRLLDDWKGKEKELVKPDKKHGQEK
jgi:hypothetical protein